MNSKSKMLLPDLNTTQETLERPRSFLLLFMNQFSLSPNPFLHPVLQILTELPVTYSGLGKSCKDDRGQ